MEDHISSQSRTKVTQSPRIPAGTCQFLALALGSQSRGGRMCTQLPYFGEGLDSVSGLWIGWNPSVGSATFLELESYSRPSEKVAAVGLASQTPPPHIPRTSIALLTLRQIFDAFENTPFVFLLLQGGLVWITSPSPPSFQVCVPSVDRHSPLDLPVTAPFVGFTGLKL